MFVSTAVSPAIAQEVLDRPPQLSGGWIGIPGALEVHVRQLAWREFSGAPLSSTSNVALGFTPNSWLLLGSIVALQSRTVPHRPTEWELSSRLRLLDEQRGAPATVAGTVAWNGAAGDPDAGAQQAGTIARDRAPGSLGVELAAARWFGPARLLGSARVLTNAYDEGRTRTALGGGAIVHPREGRMPIALSGDVVALTNRHAGERVAWSTAVNVGISHTTHTLALFATNGTSATLQGTSLGAGRTRYGVELTIPMGIGRLFGWYPPREEAMRAVTGDTDAAPAATVDMRRYLFEPRAIEITAGQTVEWVNRDAIVHTANADDGAWQSGAIPPGERWRATFSRPGRYPYYCGPHPYMRGIVIVR